MDYPSLPVFTDRDPPARNMQEKSRRTYNGVFEMPAMLPTTSAKLAGDIGMFISR
jgi:hypothetical protein